MIGHTIAGNIKSYDWATWLIGIMRAFISGGAGALAGATGPMIVDPKDWNLGAGLHNTLISMLIGFVLLGIVHMGIFLQTHGAPEQTQEAHKP